MNDNKKLKEIINRDLDVRASNETHDRMRDIVLDAHGHSQDIESAKTLIRTRSILMKNPIARLAVAAAIVAAVLIGISLFSHSGSGVAWADVAQKVEASSGVVFRIRETGKGDPNEQWPNGYRVIQRNATLSRLDWYRGDQIHRTVYFDLTGETEIWVAHDASVYSKQTMSDEKIQKMRAGGLGWTDPQGLLNRGLSLEHHALGQKTIDGMLCEGIEATGPDGSTARVWVGVETGYPVLVEIESIEDGNVRRTSTMDQFQWDIALSPEDVEPEIPASYRPLE